MTAELSLLSPGSQKLFVACTACLKQSCDGLNTSEILQKISTCAHLSRRIRVVPSKRAENGTKEVKTYSEGGGKKKGLDRVRGAHAARR